MITRLRSTIARLRNSLGTDPALDHECRVIALLGVARDQISDLRDECYFGDLDHGHVIRTLDRILDTTLSPDAVYDASHPAVTS